LKCRRGGKTKGLTRVAPALATSKALKGRCGKSSDVGLNYLRKLLSEHGINPCRHIGLFTTTLFRQFLRATDLHAPFHRTQGINNYAETELDLFGDVTMRSHVTAGLGHKCSDCLTHPPQPRLWAGRISSMDRGIAIKTHGGCSYPLSPLVEVG